MIEKSIVIIGHSFYSQYLVIWKESMTHLTDLTHSIGGKNGVTTLSVRQVKVRVNKKVCIVVNWFALDV